MEFKEGTVYVFQSKLVVDDNPTEADLLWRSKCNNRIVKIAQGGYLGTIEVDGVIYKVIRKWTRVLSPDKVDAFLKATNQVNPNK
jgi:hypothetical protein